MFALCLFKTQNLSFIQNEQEKKSKIIYQLSPFVANTFDKYVSLTKKQEISEFEKEMEQTLEYIKDFMKQKDNDEWTFVRGPLCTHLRPFTLEKQLDKWLLDWKQYDQDP